MNAYEISETADRVVVSWPTSIPFTPRTEHENELTNLVRGSKALVFDFSSTRAVGTRWLRLLQRLTIVGDEMGKTLFTAGLHETLLGKADLIAIRGDLHIVESLADAVES